jgi:hypothetical protein
VGMARRSRRSCLVALAYVGIDRFWPSRSVVT